MPIMLRAVLLACLGLAGLAAEAGSARAQGAYPTKPIEVVNSFSPGGANDLNVRALQTVAERVLGAPLVQVFKPGGGGITGATEVAHTTPDGYKLLVVSSGELTAGPNLTKVSYALDSFAFIGRISVKPYGFVVRAGAPWKDFTEFRRQAAAEPGKLTIGTTPRGGVFLTAQHLIRHGGIALTSVPYGGSGPYLTAVLGGHVDAAWAPVAAAESHLKAGTLRMLAVTGPDRLKAHPGVPTFKELGIDSPFVQWIGLVAPRSVPADRLATLRDGLARVVRDPQFVENATRLGVDATYATATDFETLVREEDKVFRALVKDLGLTPK